MQKADANMLNLNTVKSLAVCRIKINNPDAIPMYIAEIATLRVIASDLCLDSVVLDSVVSTILTLKQTRN